MKSLFTEEIFISKMDADNSQHYYFSLIFKSSDFFQIVWILINHRTKVDKSFDLCSSVMNFFKNFFSLIATEEG